MNFELRMRQLLYIFVLSVLSTTVVAQDSIPEPLSTSTTELSNDSTSIFFDELLAAIDTTECTSDTLITELPDSVYKTRLQALPFVIEVPYNEVVRRYILRYVKHSPRQLASLQRKAEYYFPIFEDILGKHHGRRRQ